MGAVTALAQSAEVSRAELYRLKEQAEALLQDAFAPQDPTPIASTVPFAKPDLQRAVLVLRLATPASVCDIIEVLPLLTGVSWSVGKVQGVLAEANQRAFAFLASVDLSGVRDITLDEMFVGGSPLLTGLDLHSHYLFALHPAADRTIETWSAFLQALRDQQRLSPRSVVKDAGSTIENVHSVLRPYFGVQKGGHTGFLPLFQFYWNTRVQSGGRNQGRSALEVLTGQKVGDWLSVLGYPPSPGFQTH